MDLSLMGLPRLHLQVQSVPMAEAPTHGPVQPATARAPSSVAPGAIPPALTGVCDVCGDSAGQAHLNYGANTCLGCRAFFRRVVQRFGAQAAALGGDAVRLTCKGDGNNRCAVTADSRRCQRCRYERCLAVGMRPVCVLSKAEVERRFRNRKNRIHGGGQQGGEVKRQPLLVDERSLTLPAAPAGSYCRGYYDTMTPPASSRPSPLPIKESPELCDRSQSPEPAMKMPPPESFYQRMDRLSVINPAVIMAARFMMAAAAAAATAAATNSTTLSTQHPDLKSAAETEGTFSASSPKEVRLEKIKQLYQSSD